MVYIKRDVLRHMFLKMDKLRFSEGVCPFFILSSQFTKKISQATTKSYLTGIRAIINFGIEENYIHWFKMTLPKMDEVQAKHVY